jgi:alkylhydroperoxidase family enzyme
MRLGARPELAPAWSYAPEAVAALESAYDAASRAIDPEFAATMRHRVAEQLGSAPLAEPTHPATGRERACFDFTDQFVVYVPAVGSDARAGVADALGEENVSTLAEMIYVFDMTARLVCALGRLFEPGPADADADADLAPVEPRPLTEATERLHAAAMLLHELDPVTTELVRLHCARYHDCKT